MGTIRARPSDMISNLPDNIIENILMCLPTRDAVRTSILSKTWRYRWTKLPRLILDEMFWNKPIVNHSDMNTVAVILYQILLLHEGPIKKFTLSIPGLVGCPEIDNIIVFLSRNGIENLILNMNQYYRLPSSFFTCQQLRDLSLRSCLIETPPGFKGFSRLTALKLVRVDIRHEQLESLISNCPLLEILDLLTTRIFDDRPIEVDAPNMKFFRLCGLGIVFIFKNVPRLSTVIYLPLDLSIAYVVATPYKLGKFFNDLPVIKDLCLNYTFIESLVAGEVPSRLLTTLVYLQHLNLLEIPLHENNVLSFILCLLRSSPNLNCFKIEFSHVRASNTNVCLELLNGQGCSDVQLNRLKEVKMQEVYGTMAELEIIKFLLAKSPRLKQMQIQPSEQTEGNGYKILKEMIKFPRASTEAEVIYDDTQKSLV